MRAPRRLILHLLLLLPIAGCVAYPAEVVVAPRPYAYGPPPPPRYWYGPPHPRPWYGPPHPRPWYGPPRPWRPSW
jgi:hypothetical protein